MGDKKIAKLSGSLAPAFWFGAGIKAKEGCLVTGMATLDLRGGRHER